MLGVVMMEKRILTSSGKVVDLERGDDVEKLGADGIAISPHTYGSSHNQFFCFDERRFNIELDEFSKLFPSSIPWSVVQDPATKRIVFKIFPTFEWIRHEVHLVLSPNHPDDAIDAFVIYPDLDRRYMGHHWYGPNHNHICYLEFWERSWTVLKVAVQVMCWLTDYYAEKNGRNTRYYTNSPKVWRYW
jgi:hypothetical protein